MVYRYLMPRHSQQRRQLGLEWLPLSPLASLPPLEIRLQGIRSFIWRRKARSPGATDMLTTFSVGLLRSSSTSSSKTFDGQHNGPLSSAGLTSASYSSSE